VFRIGKRVEQRFKKKKKMKKWKIIGSVYIVEQPWATFIIRASCRDESGVVVEWQKKEKKKKEKGSSRKMWMIWIF